MTKKRPTDGDRHVGTRIRMRRTLLGLSQERLGDILGITFQQIQKYEKGTNRVGAGRLLDMAAALEVPVSYFFDGYLPTARYQEGGADILTLLATREGIALARAFVRIPDSAVRQSLVSLAETIAESAVAQVSSQSGGEC